MLECTANLVRALHGAQLHKLLLKIIQIAKGQYWKPALLMHCSEILQIDIIADWRPFEVSIIHSETGQQTCHDSSLLFIITWLSRAKPAKVSIRGTSCAAVSLVVMVF